MDRLKPKIKATGCSNFGGDWPRGGGVLGTLPKGQFLLSGSFWQYAHFLADFGGQKKFCLAQSAGPKICLPLHRRGSPCLFTPVSDLPHNNQCFQKTMACFKQGGVHKCKFSQYEICSVTSAPSENIPILLNHNSKVLQPAPMDVPELSYSCWSSFTGIAPLFQWTGGGSSWPGWVTPAWENSCPKLFWHKVPKILDDGAQRLPYLNGFLGEKCLSSWIWAFCFTSPPLSLQALKDWFAYRPPFADRRSKWAEYCSIRHDSGSWLGWSQKFF